MLTTTVHLIVGCTNDEAANAESEDETDCEKDYASDDVRFVHFDFSFLLHLTKIKGHPTQKQDTPICLVVTFHDLKLIVGSTHV